MMELLYEDTDWTEEDEAAVIEIKDNAMWLFRYFIIGMICCVVLIILLKIIDWYCLFGEFRGILR